MLLRFLLVGALNTVIGLFCVFAAASWLGLDYLLANAIGYAVGGGLGFVLNRSWTFQRDSVWWSSLGFWFATVAASYGLNLLTVTVLYTGLRLGPLASQFAGMAVYTGATFLGGRYFAFNAPGRAVAAQAT